MGMTYEASKVMGMRRVRWVVMVLSIYPPNMGMKNILAVDGS